MGDYEYQDHVELFGGPPDRDEQMLDEVDQLRKEAKENPPPTGQPLYDAGPTHKVSRDLLVGEVVHHYLRLRELLVRGDENMKAWVLLQTIPYWVIHHDLEVAIAEQREMVLHAIEPEAYTAYYEANPHDKPMEEQYADNVLTVTNAHEVFPRLAMAREWLAEIFGGAPVSVVDLSGNDGLMMSNLIEAGLADEGSCVFDLDPRCVTRASARGLTARHRDFRKVPPWHETYNVAILFETIEHLPDPIDGVRQALKWAPELYVSTPIGAVERLDLPTWARVERKGHLHSFLPPELARIIREAGGEIIDFRVGWDAVMVARVKRKEK